MRGVFQSGPKFLVVFPSLNARRVSVRTKTSGDMFQFKCEAFFGQNLNPGNSYQSKCKAFCGQVRNSWRYFPVKMRGVVRSEPKFLAIFSSLNARRYSIRTGIRRDISQVKWGAFFGRRQNSWRRFQIGMRGVIRPEPKFLAVFTNVRARRYSARTEIPFDRKGGPCFCRWRRRRRSWRLRRRRRRSWSRGVVRTLFRKCNFPSISCVLRPIFTSPLTLFRSSSGLRIVGEF